MRRRGLVGLAVLTAVFVGALGRAPGGGAQSPALSLSRPDVPSRLEKLDSRLRAVATTRAIDGLMPARAVARAQEIEPTSRGVVVIVEPSGSAGAAEDAVTAAGGTVDATAGRLIQARITTDRLAALAQSPAVKEVRAPALHAADSITDEGVAAINAPAWQTAGFTGTGVKVGVIDVGFAGYQALLGTELPAAVTTETEAGCAGHFTTDEDHGTAVAEIVHDVAPGAQLYLICISTEVDLANAEAYAKAQGITIINHSVSWFDTSRGDGTGGPTTPEAIAADARANGILWVNAAGNQAQAHWQGGFIDDGSGMMEPVGPIPVPAGQGVCIALRWDEWPTTIDDYDLYLVDDADTVLAASTTSQLDTPSEPTEELCWSNTGASARAVHAVIADFSVPFPGRRMDLFVLGPDVAGATAAGSVTEPASSPAVLAVGAFCWDHSAIEPYSSVGPTLDERVKPDILAPDSVSTSTYGPAGRCGVDGFAGTSASAPHVAGVAALVKQRFPSLGVGALEAAIPGPPAPSPTDQLALVHPPLLWLPPLVSLGALAYDRGYGGQLMVANGDGSDAHEIPVGGGTGRRSRPTVRSSPGRPVMGRSRRPTSPDPTGSSSSRMPEGPAIHRPRRGRPAAPRSSSAACTAATPCSPFSSIRAS